MTQVSTIGSRVITTIPKREIPDDIGPEDVIHLFCENCNDKIAVCGFDAGDWDFIDMYDDSEPYCPLCMELEDKPCFRCGEI